MWEASLVGGATSMVNLIIHALLMAIVVRTVQRLSVAHGSFIYDLVQRTVVIVATGTLLVAGHYVEVMLWAFTYGLAEAAAPGPISSISPSAITRRSAMATCCPWSAGRCSGR